MEVQIPEKMEGLLLEQYAKSKDQEQKPYNYKTDLSIPKVEPHHLLLKIMSAGYCHTEQMCVRGEFDHMSRQGLPMIPSHEPVGIVSKIGSKAGEMSKSIPGFKEGPVQIGDRVGATAFGNFCGNCEDCKAGSDRLKYCSNQDFFGVTANGAFAQYCVVDVRSSVRLPKLLSFDAAAPLMCAGATIYTALIKCKLNKGQSVAIVGAGALGHLGCQMAKCLEYRTIIVDSRDAPLKLCKALPYPPDVAYNNSSVDVAKKVSIEEAIKSCGGNVDAVIVATDAIPAFKFAFELVKKHGLMMVVGQPADPIPVTFTDLIFKNVTIQGSLLGSSKETKDMVDLVADKKIECKTRAYSLKDIDRLIADTALPDHAGKLVVRVSDE